MTARAATERAFAAAIAAADPNFAVRNAIRSEEDARAPIHLIAVGKAAPAMLSGAIDGREGRFTRAFLITKDGHLDRAFDSRVSVYEAAHPVLDSRTLEATSALLEWVRAIEADDRVLVLLSGGGSALLEQPAEGVSLADFQQMTSTLLLAGADIYQLNAVRSCVSRVKGGRLRQVIPARTVHTLALSDVLGNDMAVIASGPTVPSRTTIDHPLRVLQQLNVVEQMPASVMEVLTRLGQRGRTTFPDDIVGIVADNATAMDAASASLELTGLNVMRRPQITGGEARDVAASWVRSLVDLDRHVDAVISGGELTVTVQGDGSGGRNTEFALAAAIELDSAGLIGWTVASLATDGQDALTGVAGAIVDSNSVGLLRSTGFDPRKSLARNDTLPPLAEIGASVATGPTGTNVNDLYFAVRTASC